MQERNKVRKEIESSWERKLLGGEEIIGGGGGNYWGWERKLLGGGRRNLFGGEEIKLGGGRKLLGESSEGHASEGLATNLVCKVG